MATVIKGPFEGNEGIIKKIDEKK
ncbi:MAG: KOW motif-containing protein [Candidatus Peribacteria bacterium]|nr:KOW motif-containing protein [Candidatus Peribacteria bacterium]